MRAKGGVRKRRARHQRFHVSHASAAPLRRARASRRRSAEAMAHVRQARRIALPPRTRATRCMVAMRSSHARHRRQARSRIPRRERTRVSCTQRHVRAALSQWRSVLPRALSAHCPRASEARRDASNGPRTSARRPRRSARRLREATPRSPSLLARLPIFERRRQSLRLFTAAVSARWTSAWSSRAVTTWDAARYTRRARSPSPTPRPAEGVACL